MKTILTLCAVLVPFGLTACTNTPDEHGHDTKTLAVEAASPVTLEISGMT